MVDIVHRIGTTTTPGRACDVLTTLDGLTGWWTTDTTGDATPGGTLEFRFGSSGGFDMAVLDQRRDERIEWEVIDGPAEWIATHVPAEPRGVRRDRHRRAAPERGQHQQLDVSPDPVDRRLPPRLRRVPDASIILVPKRAATAGGVTASSPAGRTPRSTHVTSRRTLS